MWINSLHIKSVKFKFGGTRDWKREQVVYLNCMIDVRSKTTKPMGPNYSLGLYRLVHFHWFLFSYTCIHGFTMLYSFAQDRLIRLETSYTTMIRALCMSTNQRASALNRHGEQKGMTTRYVVCSSCSPPGRTSLSRLRIASTKQHDHAQ